MRAVEVLPLKNGGVARITDVIPTREQVKDLERIDMKNGGRTDFLREVVQLARDPGHRIDELTSKALVHREIIKVSEAGIPEMEEAVRDIILSMAIEEDGRIRLGDPIADERRD